MGCADRSCGACMDIIAESHECLVPGITGDLQRRHAVVGYAGAECSGGVGVGRVADCLVSAAC